MGHWTPTGIEPMDYDDDDDDVFIATFMLKHIYNIVGPISIYIYAYNIQWHGSEGCSHLPPLFSRLGAGTTLNYWRWLVLAKFWRPVYIPVCLRTCMGLSANGEVAEQSDINRDRLGDRRTGEKDTRLTSAADSINGIVADEATRLARCCSSKR